MNEKAGAINLTKDGVECKIRLYSGGYGSILKEYETRVGEDLEKSGAENVPAIFTYPITDMRLGGTPNSYPDFCAEIQIDNSNFQDWFKVGCINYQDTPSESPTGGLN